MKKRSTSIGYLPNQNIIWKRGDFFTFFFGISVLSDSCNGKHQVKRKESDKKSPLKEIPIERLTHFIVGKKILTGRKLTKLSLTKLFYQLVPPRVGYLILFTSIFLLSDPILGMAQKVFLDIFLFPNAIPGPK